jgi:hypothetical protein
VSDSDKSSSGQLRVKNNRGRNTRTREGIGTRSAEEHKRSACEDLMCELKALCVL